MKQHQLIKTLLWSTLLPVVLICQTNNFSFVQHDTAYVGSEDLIVQYGDIISLSSENQDLIVRRVTHQMDSTWTNSFCVGSACLPPFLSEYSFTLEAGDTSEFSLDTFPNGTPGFGSWTIFAENATTAEIDSVHISLEYMTVGVDRAHQAPGSFKLASIYPNPTNASINIELLADVTGRYTLTLLSLDGRQLLERNYTLQKGANLLQWNLDGLSSGNYLVVAQGSGQAFTQKVSVIK